MPAADSMLWERPSAAEVVIGWLMLLVWILSLISLAVQFPWALLVIALLVVVGIHMGSVEKERRTTLAKERQGESLCTFVRSLDYRATDTWILRAVYEELTSYRGRDEPVVPIRPDDELCRTLGIDAEDLTEYLLPVIAYRSGRSLDLGAEDTSLVSIRTVTDVVQFLLNQPRQWQKKFPAGDHWAMDL
jgi:hypothetical protein